MMNPKNIKLLVVLLVLVGVSVALTFWKEQGAPALDRNLFAVEDVNPVDRITMIKSDQQLEFKAFSQGFLINDTYTLDQNLLTVLGAVLQQIRVQRPASEKRQEELWQNLQQEGTLVSVYAGDQLLKSFWAGGDQQQSYYATPEGEVFLVGIPGYTDYISGLFALDAEDWRSKNIFQSTWRSILSLNFQNFSTPEDNFQIDYQDPFFTVSDVERMDSSRVVGYLQNLGALRAQSVIDTVISAAPWVRITTTDINPGRNLDLTLYQGDSVIVGKANERYYVFAKQQLQPFIQSSSFFEALQEDTIAP